MLVAAELWFMEEEETQVLGMHIHVKGHALPCPPPFLEKGQVGEQDGAGW